MSSPSVEELRDALAENEAQRLRIAEAVLRVGLEALGLLEGQGTALLKALRQAEENH